MKSEFQQSEHKYVIKAASFLLPIPFFKRCAHNFWILEDAQNKKNVAELHGLATCGSTGKIVPIGYKKDHYLKAHHIVLCEDFAAQYGLNVSQFKLPCHETKVVYSGEDALERWFKAVNAVDVINALNLSYPRGGFAIPFINTINSNSIYRTFADIMQIEDFRFAHFFQLGIEKTLLPLIEDAMDENHFVGRPKM